MLRRKAKPLTRLNDDFRGLIRDGILKVPGKVDVALLLYTMIRTGWADPAYINGAVFGFPLKGTFERSYFLRSTEPRDDVLSREELLASTPEYIDSLEDSIVPSNSPRQNQA